MTEKPSVNIDNTKLAQTPGIWQGFIGFVIVVTFTAGAIALISPRSYFPLMVGGIVVATITGVAFFWKPVLALYAAIFVALLPYGLLNPDIHSNLNRSLAVVASVVGVFDILTRHRKIQWTSTATFMVGFVAWSAVTLLWADNLSTASNTLGGYALRFILFLFLIPTYIRTKKALNGLMGMLALSGLVLMATGAWTILSQGYMPGTRLSVLDMNENGMGILALVTMIGVLWHVVQPSPRHKQLKKLASWLFLLGVIILVAASGSRGSAISLVVILLAFCFWKPTRPWGIWGLLALALGLALAPFLFVTTLDRFAVVPGDTLLGGREVLWQAAWRLILDYPWGGVGIGNSPFAMMPYVQFQRSIMGLEWATIHNPLLTIWAETGILGLLLFLGILISALWSIVRQYLLNRGKSTHYLTPYFALVSSVFVGYVFSWFKGGGVETNHVYFLMLALFLIPSGIAKEDLEAG